MGTWRYFPDQGSLENSTQIDLLFDRDDDAITICEIKYTTQPFVLDKEYTKKLQRKIDVFTMRTKTKSNYLLHLLHQQV